MKCFEIAVNGECIGYAGEETLENLQITINIDTNSQVVAAIGLKDAENNMERIVWLEEPFANINDVSIKEVGCSNVPEPKSKASINKNVSRNEYEKELAKAIMNLRRGED